MKNLNIYVTEKLRIDKNIKIYKDIEKFIDVLIRIFDWKDLKDRDEFKNLLISMNISSINDFKYLYRCNNDFPHKEKLFNNDIDFIKNHIPKFNSFDYRTVEKIEDIISGNGKSEIIMGNINLTKYVEKYLDGDKIIGFSITDETASTGKNFYINGIF